MENYSFIGNREDVLKKFNIAETNGLSAEQVAESYAKYGANSFTKEKPPSLLRRTLETLREPLIIILLAAAIVTVGVNVVKHFTGGQADWIESAGIVAAIALSVFITVWMEGRSLKAFEALNKLNDDAQIKVFRGGKLQTIAQSDVVVGDIVQIETGDKVPADGRLLQSHELTADESALTGESMPASKDSEAIFLNESVPVAERANMVYSGTLITGGTGRMVVTAVGDLTEFGKIATELSGHAKTSTPLQEKLAKLGKLITIFGSIAAIIVFVVQIASLISSGTASLETVSNALITSIVLIVASVPEGLPTIVAVSLAINVLKMAKQNALVKKMIACETIGCINVICSDKTGTLTENRMSVTDIFNGSTRIDSSANLNAQMFNNFALNTTADVDFNGDSPIFIGNPTECALLASIGNDYRVLRAQTNLLQVFAFSSDAKNMTTVAEIGGEQIAFSKGSPEKILSLCNLSETEKDSITKQIAALSEQSRRVLAFCHKKIDANSSLEDRAAIETNMHFDGFVGITDPLREEVYDAVLKCRSAGISIKMLTGDNIVTATAIAKELNMLDDNKIAVEAKDLEALSDEEFSAILPKICVIARSTPIIKMRVVQALKAQGNVVAVTGDGINDAPAIKNADVGIAMGIAGTEVSKAASDIVLLDDSFATIAKAVEWGRGIYENFQRFIIYQLTGNVTAVTVILASIFLGLSVPFTALQILWINIVMDGPPALSLGLESIRSDLMRRPPTKRNESILRKTSVRNLIVSAVYISAVVLLQNKFDFLGAGDNPALHASVLFTMFVMCQLVNAFNSREIGNQSIFRNLFGNKLMLGAFAAVFVLQIIITQFGGTLYRTVPLEFNMWLKILGIALTVVIPSEIVKLLARIKERRLA